MMQDFTQDQLDELKSRVTLSSIFDDYGYKVRGARNGIGFCLCPFHAEKTPSCEVDDRKGLFNCHGCAAAGDAITAIRHLGSKTFVEAVEALGGTREITPEDRARIEAQRRQIEREEREKRERAMSSAERWFAKGEPVAKSHAGAYLAARRLVVVPRWTFDLRFIPSMVYRGFASADADEETELGSFPVMIAAVRDVDGAMIGLHRTYLDPEEPRKLVPPGDRKRNSAKKILGEMRGGMIRLSPVTRHMAMGEGVETSQSWRALGYGETNISIAAAVSLGNLCGSSEGSIAHPSIQKRKIPNGIPDMEKPGVILPVEVQEITLIGDGDGDRPSTHAKLLTAARRFEAAGRIVRICVAPIDKDFNDVLMAEAD